MKLVNVWLKTGHLQRFEYLKLSSTLDKTVKFKLSHFLEYRSEHDLHFLDKLLLYLSLIAIKLA